MKLTVLTPDEASKRGHWMEAHAEGCGHLRFRTGGTHFAVEADSREAACREIAADFIAEGSMTVEDALQAVHFGPCVRLPMC